MLSGDWSGLLAPFGVVRQSDATDGRLLVDVAEAEAAGAAP